MEVFGIDKNEQLINDLKIFKPHFHEKGLKQMLQNIAKGKLPPTYQVELDCSVADIYIITVGTPILKPSLEPDLNYVSRAATEVSKVLKKGDMVILRSTVPVGTTRNIVLPILEKGNHLIAGKDFDLAFCPERTVEGKALKELRELPQVIGGLTAASTNRAQRLFQKVTSTTINLGKIEASEMLKILDNTYRDMMFAYSNQMALVCHANELNMFPIVNAANQGYNRNNIPIPSPGVGGACLSKDPYILASVCRKSGIDPNFFIKGRSINEYMPIHTIKLVEEHLNSLNKKINESTIFVMGFAFKGKPETSDMRDSPTIDLVKDLKRRGATIIGQDPLVDESEIKNLGVQLSTIENGFRKADAVIIMIDHPSYSDLDLTSMTTKRQTQLIMMDPWNLYQAGELLHNKNIIHLHL